ncbi:hypothetical protein tinsulaeT_14690 [Thalassotalea insulae]|uniref:Polysaccharide export outer membrane protein n=1 Tax=Thalassotalea insulae TaxID=2056778 RepID=A0ABQ6GSI0_9GAMM|nr:polysaccharide biosynthesis/export family protein [Thalassotalea insulae]GLX78129.1 hypothetical protein tinsulaeT_14690 [Thalassotalea insulae]
MQFILALLIVCCSCLVQASDYRLGAGDEVAISVYGEPDLSINVKISKSGVITFPFLDDINVLGLSTKALAEKIRAGLLEDYLVDPQVTVSIVEYRPFFIHGQVNRPGGYPYQDDLTLDKAIALAGGLASRASKSEWKITRKVDGKNKVIQGVVMTQILPDDIIEIEQSFF